ncbi:hypothetical protein ACFU8W_43360 [Streptomyces sp. NPDC057565]|uniref:hypothetical protein n=1 Tax=Streptomyces sp. NPDC057565 TaxID=3346169 RepID=UPI0036D01819
MRGPSSYPPGGVRGVATTHYPGTADADRPTAKRLPARRRYGTQATVEEPPAAGTVDFQKLVEQQQGGTASAS